MHDGDPVLRMIPSTLGVGDRCDVYRIVDLDDNDEG